MSVAGKTAVVTGAASGLGRATALGLARAGASVVAAGLEPEELNATVALIEEDGGNAVAVPTNVADGAEVQSMATRASEAFGGTDILVNNAAIYPSGPWHEVAESEWDRVFAVNVRGYFSCAKALRPQMVERGGGSIVNISSITFFMGAEGFLAYVTSKGAVVGFTRALAREAGPEGIRVNCIAPGAFPTRAEEIPGRDLEQYERDVLAGQAIKRRGRPEDIANAVLFFASDQSSFITGQTLLVDGGWYMS